MKKLVLILCMLLVLVGGVEAREKDEMPVTVQESIWGTHYAYKSELKGIEISPDKCYRLYAPVAIYLNDVGKAEMQKRFNTKLNPRAIFMKTHIDFPPDGKMGEHPLFIIESWDCFFEDENGKSTIGVGQREAMSYDMLEHKFWGREFVELAKIFSGEKKE